MRVLIAPLNWGLGHASRCIPLIARYLAAGDEVVIGGNGASLALLRQHFPDLEAVALGEMELRYGAGERQMGVLLRQVPQVVRSAREDRKILRRLIEGGEGFDLVVSDNRFGLWARGVQCVYMTHQLRIRLPRGWRWAEGIASGVHRLIWGRYDEVWVPDYEAVEDSLSGALGHGMRDKQIRWIGPLSRFEKMDMIDNQGDRDGLWLAEIEEQMGGEGFAVVAVLSGLEPHRGLLERELVARYRDSGQAVLVVQGLVGEPMAVRREGSVWMVPQLGDRQLAEVLRRAEQIVARSGYSTIMDLEALGVLDRAELIATPGQPEQVYLAEWLAGRLSTKR